MSILDKYRKSGNLVLDLDFRKKSILDQSAYANNPTAITNSVWANTRFGSAVRTNTLTTGNITIPDSASLQITQGVIVLFGNFSKSISSIARPLFYKVAGTGTSIYFHIVNSTTIRMQCGATLSDFTVSTPGKKFLAIRFTSSAKPELWVDGAYAGQGTNALPSLTAPTGSLLLFGSGGSNGLGEPINRVLALNTVNVENVDISRLYDELMTERGAGDPKTRNYRFSPSKVTDPTCVIQIDAEYRRADGYYADLSGNGNNGQSKGIVTQTNYPFGKTAKFNGVNGVVGFGAMNTGTKAIGTNDYSYGGWFHTGTLAGSYLVAAYNSSPLFYLNVSAAGGFSSRYQDSGLVNVSASSSVGLVRANEWHHLVVSGDRDGLLQIYLDGVSVANASIAAGVANSMSTTNELLICAYNSYASPGSLHNGSFKDFRVYNGKALSATEIKNWYNEYATKPTYDSQAEYWLPTLATVASGNLSNTGFIVSGNFTVIQETNKQKWIKRIGTGNAYRAFKNAYGSFYFKIKPMNLGTNYMFGIYNGNAVATDASQNGYVLRTTATGVLALSKVTAGVTSAIITMGAGYVSADTTYEICITRNYAGLWTVYIRGGAYTNWTLVGSGTENTFTTCNYIVCTPVNTEMVSDIRHYAGVLDLTSLPI